MIENIIEEERIMRQERNSRIEGGYDVSKRTS